MAEVLVVQPIFAYEPLENIRKAMQLSEDSSGERATVYAGGRPSAFPRFKPYLMEREEHDGPLTEDVGRAKKIASYMNQITEREVVGMPSTFDNASWITRQHQPVLNALKTMTIALRRAEQRQVVTRDIGKDRLFLQEVAAECLVGRAILKVQPITHWPDPAVRYNPCELLALRSEFPDISNIYFSNALSRTAIRKYRTRGLLKLLSSTDGQAFHDIYSRYLDIEAANSNS